MVWPVQRVKSSPVGVFPGGITILLPRTSISGAGTVAEPEKFNTYGFSAPFGSLFVMLMLPENEPAATGANVMIKVVVFPPVTDAAKLVVMLKGGFPVKLPVD